MQITQFHIDHFKPTFLYIKQHSVTGKLYFGKTSRKNVESYTGSGIHWGRHISAHGRDKVVTLWWCLFTDIHSLVSTATDMSDIMQITESEDWLNFKPENGLDGGSAIGFNGFKGKAQTEKQKSIVSALGRIRPATDKMRENMSRVGKMPRTQKQRAASRANGLAKARPKEIRNHVCPICNIHFSKFEFCHHTFNHNKTCSRKCASHLNPRNQFSSPNSTL